MTLTMCSPGDVLVGFELFVACQRVRLELLASLVSPDKDSPANGSPRATRFTTCGQPMAACRKVSCTAWDETGPTRVLVKKGRMRSGCCPSLNLLIRALLM